MVKVNEFNVFIVPLADIFKDGKTGSVCVGDDLHCKELDSNCLIIAMNDDVCVLRKWLDSSGVF